MRRKRKALSWKRKLGALSSGDLPRRIQRDDERRGGHERNGRIRAGTIRVETKCRARSAIILSAL